jgi:hypothetical protein
VNATRGIVFDHCAGAINQDNTMILRMCLICKKGRSTYTRLHYRPRYLGQGFICGAGVPTRGAIAPGGEQSTIHLDRLQHPKS